MYWRFDSDALPPEAIVTRERSDTGDDCHHSISGTSDAKLTDIIKKTPMERVVIIDGGVERAVTLDDIEQDSA